MDGMEMSKAVVNGITRTVPPCRPWPSSEVQFAFKSWHQLPLFMVWRVLYAPDGEIEYAYVLFSSMDWIGI
jgi:hypothetical protein